MTKTEFEKLEDRFSELWDKRWEHGEKALTFDEKVEYWHISDALCRETQKQLFYEAIENCDYIMG